MEEWKYPSHIDTDKIKTFGKRPTERVAHSIIINKNVQTYLRARYHLHHLYPVDENNSINRELAMYIPKHIHRFVGHSEYKREVLDFLNTLALKWWKDNDPNASIYLSVENDSIIYSFVFNNVMYKGICQKPSRITETEWSTHKLKVCTINCML